MSKRTLFGLLLGGSLLAELQAKESLYFGIVDNHRPHVYLDPEERPSGTLIHYIDKLCETLDADCSYSTNNFFKHLDSLQAGQINGLLVTDTVLLPSVDEIIFTPPLCQIAPVFIHKVRNKDTDYKSVDDIKNATIGVHLDSSFHIYLLDEYFSQANIKPYSLIESGVFDLANDRIDALLAEQAFFEDRVATTTLVSKKKSYYLDTLDADKVKLSYKTMSLALRAQDTELHSKISKAISDQGPTESCVALVHKALERTSPAKPSEDTSESEPLIQGNESK